MLDIIQKDKQANVRMKMTVFSIINTIYTREYSLNLLQQTQCLYFTFGSKGVSVPTLDIDCFFIKL